MDATHKMLEALGYTKIHDVKLATIDVYAMPDGTFIAIQQPTAPGQPRGVAVTDSPHESLAELAKLLWNQ